MCGCNTIYLDDGIAGLDQTDLEMMGGAAAGYLGTAYLDHMIVYEKDGTTKKTGKLAEDDKMRNALYVGGGIGLNYMWGDMPVVKGGGIGMAVFGLKELIKAQYPDSKIKGTRQYIAGKDANGNQTYIGSAQSKRIDLDLSSVNHQQPHQQERVIITNSYA